MKLNAKGILAALALAATLLSGPSMARDNSTVPNRTTMSDLEGRGYTCERAGVGYWLCTKGDSKWGCSSQGCWEMASLPPGNRLPHLDPNAYPNLEITR